MQSEHFIFDGIKSQDMEEMYLVHMESGLVESPFFGGQDIREEWVKGRVTPYDYGSQLNPIEFTIQISPLEKEWTPEVRSAIGKWLIHGEYKSFQTADDLDKYYYVRCIEAPNFHLANNRGYLELTFRTNSPYAWSKVYSNTYDLSTNTDVQTIQVENLSNINKKYRPKIEIQLVGGETNVSLKNISNNDMEFKFAELRANEIVSIDNENEFIKSNNHTSNPFAKFNGQWLDLVYGTNEIEVTGKCIIKIRSQFPILQ